MKLIKLVASIALCQSAGLLGSFFTVPAVSGWYETLKKPDFSPPNWLFGPVWISLYTLMGISLFLVWNTTGGRSHFKKGMLFFFIQLVLNALWSIFFFGLRSPLAGLIEMVLLWATIVITFLYFIKLSRWAGILLLPYLAWVSFAFVLNFNLWILNR